MAKKYLLFIVIFISKFLYGFEEDLRFMNINFKDFRASKIIEITQDSVGFIWIASTDKGVAKFDGVNITQYLTNKNALKIKISPKNDIYVLTLDGIYKYDKYADNFNEILISKSLDSTRIRHFEILDSSKFLITIPGSVFIANINTGEKDLLCNLRMVNDFVQVQNGDFWFSLNVGIAVKKANSDSMSYFGVSNTKGIYYDENDPDHIWYLTSHQIIKRNIITGETSSINSPGSKILFTGFFFSEDKIIISVNKGVLYYDFKEKKLTKLYYSENTNTHIFNIFIDKSGTYWFASNTGIIKSYPKEKISHIDINKKNENYYYDLFSSNFIKHLHIGDRNDLYYMTVENMLVRITPLSKFILYQPFVEFNEIPETRDIIEHSKTEVLIATKSGIFLFNLKTKTIQKISDEKVFCISKNDSSTYLMSTMSELLLVDNDGKILSPKKLNNITAIYQVKRNLYWLVSHSKGLLLYDAGEQKILEQISVKEIMGQHTDKKPEGLGLATSLYVDDGEGLFYIGTITNGLLLYNKKTGEKKRYSLGNSAIGEKIVGIAKVKDEVWINFTNGIGVFQKEKFKYLLDETHGLKCFENTDYNKYWKYTYRNKNLLTVDNESRVYIAGRNGVSHLQPKGLMAKSRKMPMIMTSIQVFGQEKYKKEIVDQKKDFQFSYKDNIITMGFSVFNYSDTEKNKFYFCLENFNTNWEVSIDNTVTFKNLNPGEYVLKTRYSDHTGGMHDGPTYKLTIIPPIWQTKSFYIVSILVLSILIAGIIRFQTYRIKSQKSALEYRVVRRTHELQKKKDELENINTHLEELVTSRTQKLQEANVKLKEEFDRKEHLLRELQNSRETIEMNLKEQTLISNISMDLISLENFQEKVNQILKIVGERLGLESVFLLEDNHSDEEVGSILSWSKNDNQIKIENFEYREQKEWLSLMHSNEILICEDFSELEENVTNLIKRLNISSILIFPILVSQQFFGFIGAVNYTKNQWGNSTVTFFRTLAHIVSNAYERKIYQMELLDKEKTSKALLDASDSFAILFDIAGKIKLTNANFLQVINKNLDEVIGTSIFDYFDKSLLPKRQENFELCIKKKKTIHYEDELNGEIYSNNVSPVLDSKGEVIRIAHFTHNITKQKKAERILKRHQEELKTEVMERTKELRFINNELLREIKNREKAEEELIVSEKLKRENLKKLALQLAHEIKNPLSSINSSAQLVETIQTMKPDVESTIKHMKRITKNVDTCNRVIKELYEFTHDSQFNIQEVQTTVIAEELLEYGENSSNGKNLTIQINNKVPGMHVFIDKFKILQALKNIVANSCDAIETTGNIDLVFSHIGDNLKIEILDDGPGMSDETLERIFEPFFTSKSKGFGLGLAIVKKIIERHGGKIQVESKLNAGTKTTIELPLAYHGEVNE